MCSQYEATNQRSRDAVGYRGLAPEGRERCWPYQHLFAVCLSPKCESFVLPQRSSLEILDRENARQGKREKKVKERGARWEVEHKWSPLYFWHSWAHLITLSFKEMLQVQYKLSSIDNICGIMLITTKKF